MPADRTQNFLKAFILPQVLQQLITDWVLRIFFYQEFGIDLGSLAAASFQIEVSQRNKMINVVRLLSLGFKQSGFCFGILQGKFKGLQGLLAWIGFQQ